jgi:hypothetical protein
MRQSGHVRSPCQHVACQTDWLAEDLKKDAEMQELVCDNVTHVALQAVET